MKSRIILASFAAEDDLLGAVQALQKHAWPIADIYTPYAVHGLEAALGWPRSRLPVACFLGGAAGVSLALWFQFWATAQNWPLNVGGRPWNSLPAFVPVAFECMVLLAGFGVAFAWLCRCRLYPGKEANLAAAGSTNDRFVVAVHEPASASDRDTVHHLLRQFHVVDLQEREEEQL
jgi:hypothetical protein